MLASRWTVAPSVLLVAALGASGPVSGEESGATPPSRSPEEKKAAPATPPGTQAQPGGADRVVEEEVKTPYEDALRKIEERRRRGVRAPAAEDVPAPLPGWPYWRGWYPFFSIPQTYYHKDYYPPSITHVPRLGLQYNYPFAYQMGLRIPDDSDPLTEEHSPANLGPFVGFVGALRELAAAESSGADEAIPLIREKKYREAGKLLAEGYRDSDDPRYPILLAEVFFLLGKYDHAEALFQHGLSMKDAERALPEDVSGHIASPEELSEKIREAGDKQRLVTAYMLLHSKEPARGLDMLLPMSQQGDKIKPAGLLYRRYVEKGL
jgi:hypothetical protein